MTAADVEALDRADPLAAFRDRFDLPEGVIYLDGNSLGALPRATAARLQTVVREEWGRGLIGSWNAAGWIEAPRRVGARIAPLVGAAADEVIAADSTSVLLFKLVAAALAMRPGRRVILSEPGNFPTDLYVAQGLERMGLAELRLAPADEIAEAVDGDTACVLLTHAHYKTAALHDMAAVTRAAHAAGALALWDLSHSVGAVEIDLRGCDADLAVGCGYKYLNGGPGAPAFAFVARRLQAELPNPISGWMGHAAPFSFEDGYRPAEGLDRLLSGTPSILGLAALEEGARLMAEAGAPALAAKSRALGERFVAAVEAEDAAGELRLASPRDHARRGAHVSFHHPEAYALCQALIADGVVGDFREPDIVRFGFPAAYLRYADVAEAARRIGRALRERRWDDPTFRTRARVT